MKAKLISCPSLSSLTGEAILRKKIVAIFAHPDDESIFLGGTLIKARKQGFKTTLLTLTQGGRGGKLYDIYGEKLALIRKRELQKAAKILGISKLIHYNFPDGLTGNYKNIIKKKITKVLTKEKAFLIFTHNFLDKSQHKDHIVIGKSVVEAYKDINLKKTCKLYLVDYKEAENKKNFCTNISDYIKGKIDACLSHKSQGLFTKMPVSPKVYFSFYNKEYFILFEP